MGVAASSSSSSSSCKKYEVFLSFRGEDTRTTFTDHLYAALCLRGIETYIDYELPKGDDISQSLIQAIENSSLSVVIFSESYANSRWCLNELLHILRCKQHQAQLVVPIFYQVDPSHVRHQRGTYEEAFAQHLNNNPHKVEEWRQALFETANLAGWDSRLFEREAVLIQNIVNDIMQKLSPRPSTPFANFVGIEENSNQIESLLKNSSIIGIWGMGGVGKTTMAKVVFTKFSSQFDSCCFLQNLREESEKYGLKFVRDKLFSELSKDTSLGRFHHKKVFVVLDDVSDTRQLDYLENEAPPLGPGSKVIITSRDKHVLDGRVERIHKARALGYDNSLKLFNLKAFGQDGYKKEYKEVVERAVAYAQGIPLALTILGSFLHSRTVEEWGSALNKIESTIHKDIRDVLKLSYAGLDDEEKGIFLDIAFFLKGESRDYAIGMLESCGFHAIIGLRTLMDKALISIDRVVQMHDLIQSMAFEIVRQECMENPGGRSRLRNPDEIYDVLKNNRGSDAIQGISLDLSQIRDLQLSSDAFRKMPHLTFLKFYLPWDKRSFIVNLPLEFESLSNSLRYLRWDNFPSESLPLSFCAEKLVELCMPGSQLTKLWDGVQDLENLRKINLAGSKQLRELPDFSRAQNLKQVDFSGCESLCHLYPSILSLPRLSYVDLGYCQNLKSLKAESPSKSISYLKVTGCHSLKEFSFSSDKITGLDLRRTGVEILDFSMGLMDQLQQLYLKTSTLKNLPINDICCMISVQELRLDDCGALIDKSKLHTLFEALQSLKSISLSRAWKLTELPDNIKHLSSLRSLDVSFCKDLQSLPELPPSIEELSACNCMSLKILQLTSHTESSFSYLRNLRRLSLRCCEQLYELPGSIDSLSSLSSLNLSGSNVKSLPDGIKHLSNLVDIYLSHCTGLLSLPKLLPFFTNFHVDGCRSLEEHSLSHVMDNAHFSLKRLVYTGQSGEVYYPGRKVPEWFTSNQGTVVASNNVTIELPSTSNNRIGFIFCCVLSKNCDSRLDCKLYCHGKLLNTSEFGMMLDFDTHHVLLWCESKLFTIYGREKDSNHRPKVSFEFSVISCPWKLVDGEMFKESEKVVDGVIEACGVFPIYASEYPNFIQQMESNWALGTQKETCHDVDESSFDRILNFTRFSLKQGKCGNFEGSLIPKWFKYKSSRIEYGSLKVRVKLAPDFENLKGFIFCFVIPDFSSTVRDQRYSSWAYSFDGWSHSPIAWHYSMVKLNSDNVFIWYYPLNCERIIQNLRRLRRWGKGNDVDLKFRFNFGDGVIEPPWGVKFRNCLIEECGVHPIYASEYTNFLQQNKLKVNTQRKRHRNIDEDQHQLPSTKKFKDSSIIPSIPSNFESKTSHDADELLLMLSQMSLESTKNHAHQK